MANAVAKIGRSSRGMAAVVNAPSGPNASPSVIASTTPMSPSIDSVLVKRRASERNSREASAHADETHRLGRASSSAGKPSVRSTNSRKSVRCSASSCKACPSSTSGTAGGGRSSREAASRTRSSSVEPCSMKVCDARLYEAMRCRASMGAICTRPIPSDPSPMSAVAFAQPVQPLANRLRTISSFQYVSVYHKRSASAQVEPSTACRVGSPMARRALPTRQRPVRVKRRR